MILIDGFLELYVKYFKINLKFKDVINEIVFMVLIGCVFKCMRELFDFFVCMIYLYLGFDFD